MDSDTDNLLFRLRELTEKAEAKAKAQGNWGLARDILRESVSLQVLFARPEVQSPLHGRLGLAPEVTEYGTEGLYRMERGQVYGTAGAGAPQTKEQSR